VRGWWRRETVEKECSEVGFGLAGDPRGDHSCLSNLIEGLDGVTQRGLARGAGRASSGGWEQLIDVNTNTGDIRRTWVLGLEREGWRERVEGGREKKENRDRRTAAGCL
jgi:hypothetical protein